MRENCRVPNPVLSEIGPDQLSGQAAITTNEREIHLAVKVYDQRMKKKIGIIGAGIRGLLACKHAMEKGFNPMVFEARSGLGGVWSQTIESTKLQTPKNFFQFSDFAWPSSVKESFPDHNQVMEYLQGYAANFNIIPRIIFNSRVTCIDYVTPSEEDLLSWDLWGGTGIAISPTGKWDVTLQDARNPSAQVVVIK